LRNHTASWEQRHEHGEQEQHETAAQTWHSRFPPQLLGFATPRGDAAKVAKMKE
jgi:hypothetical protein